MAKQFDLRNKSKDLLEYTILITSNKKRYPSKYVTLIKRIQNCCMDIFENIHDANSLDVKRFKNERIALQTQAIRGCDKLSTYVEISMNLKRIGSDTAGHWQGLISDVKYLAIGWRKSDENR